MKAMIFAAGLGTRLKPLTDRMPKALVPLAGKSLIEWQVEKLREAGIREIVVNVHHFPDMIMDAIRENKGWGCEIQVSDERDCLLETGGGLRKAGELLLTSSAGEKQEEPILVCNVDILSNIDLKALIAEWRKAESDTLGMLVVSERETQRYLLFDEDGRLGGWTNVKTGEVKPAGASVEKRRKLAFSGMQILSPKIFGKMDAVVAEKGEKFSLIDLYLNLCEKEVFRAYLPTDYRMMDVGKIDQIEEAERFAESL